MKVVKKVLEMNQFYHSYYAAMNQNGRFVIILMSHWFLN